MDPLTIASSAVSFLIPYLVKAGKFVAKEAGPALEKVKAIHKAVKDALSGEDYTAQTFERVEKEPESEPKQKALTAVLEEKVKDDPSFAKTLKELLEQAKGAGAEQISMEMNISGHAKVGKAIQIGKAHDIDLSEKK